MKPNIQTLARLQRHFLTLLFALSALCSPAVFAKPAPADGSKIAAALQVAVAAEPLTLKDGDMWVMAGDSITAQRQHSNYIEAFYRTRHPHLKLHFRNSGIGGNVTGSVIARFGYDVAAWKPTLVSVELGMNDASTPQSDLPGNPACARYMEGYKKLVALTREVGARPVLISSSPVNDGSIPGAWAGDRCRRIGPFTVALAELAKAENLPFADQYHPLLPFWGRNKTLADARLLADRAAKITPESGFPRLEALQAFGKAWEGVPGGVELGGDAVHPGPVGQYTMAATILTALGADPEVSSATVTVSGKGEGSKAEATTATLCKITDVTLKDGRLAFTRLDERLPWPIQPQVLPDVLKLLPEIADLSRYMLTVKGLPAGKYDVLLDGKIVATLESGTLAAGWNLAHLLTGPLRDRGLQIIGLIERLQGSHPQVPELNLNQAWRDASKAGNAEALAIAQAAIEKCEAALQEAVQPKPIRFEIAPATEPAEPVAPAATAQK